MKLRNKVYEVSPHIVYSYFVRRYVMTEGSKREIHVGHLKSIGEPRLIDFYQTSELNEYHFENGRIFDRTFLRSDFL